jgi:hypothetical protein
LLDEERVDELFDELFDDLLDELLGLGIYKLAKKN